MIEFEFMKIKVKMTCSKSYLTLSMCMDMSVSDHHDHASIYKSGGANSALRVYLRGTSCLNTTN